VCDLRTLVRGGNGQSIRGGLNGAGGGKVTCARGRECSGVPAGGWSVNEDEQDEEQEEVDREAEWGELADALETTGDQRWEETAESMKIKRERSGKIGGRPVEWDGKSGALAKEVYSTRTPCGRLWLTIHCCRCMAMREVGVTGAIRSCSHGWTRRRLV
jgi:hypothetical protein